MRLNKFILLLFVCCSLFGCKHPKSAEQDPLVSIPDPKTLNESYVSNPNHLLSEATVADLNAKLAPLDQAGVAHIDVVFVASIGDRVTKDLAHALFRKWKIGDQKKNNGLLILMVKDQRRVEFETGYGLEGPLPDVVCYRIQKEYIVPHAKKGNYDFAIQNGVNAVISLLQKDGFEVSPSKISGDTLVKTIDSALNTTVPEIVAPVIEAPISVYDQALDTPLPSSNSLGGWPSLVILMLYGIAAFIISGNMNEEGRIKLSNPILWLMLLVPVGSIILLDLYLPVSWIEIRQVISLYLFLSLFIQVYYWILSGKLSLSLKGSDHHEQYIKWYNTHARMEWAVSLFPLFRLYWSGYQKRLKVLRDTPPSCNSCKKAMFRLSEEQDDRYLSDGQRSEEQIKSIDYDVWECNDCKEKIILDYTNIKSKATTCTKCNYKTLLYQKRVIVESATTSSEGSGYKFSVCKNCNFQLREAFSIPRISTSSSGSSSSSSSSSSSTSSSSGGSSGGGGAGSSW